MRKGGFPVTTRAIKLSILAAVFLPMLLCIWQIGAVEFSEEDYERELATAQQWFLDSSNSLDDWSACERLGAAEVLYFTQEDSPKGKEAVIRRRITEILKPLLGNAEKHRDPNVATHRCIGRAMILKILVTDRTEAELTSQITKLTDYDPENGLAWLFRAEDAWTTGQIGDLQKCVQFCHKALRCTRLTLRDKFARARMAMALRKAGLLNDNMTRSIVLIEPPSNEITVFIRQTALLSFLDILQRIIGVDYPRIRKSMAREYLSIVSSERMIPHGVVPHIMHGKLFRALQNRNCPEMKNEKHSLEKERLDKEEQLLRLQYEALKIQVREVSNLAPNGKMEEINEFIQTPDVWWAMVKADHNDIKSAPDISVWQEFWRQTHEPASPKNSYLDQSKPSLPELFKPENFTSYGTISGRKSPHDTAKPPEDTGKSLHAGHHCFHCGKLIEPNALMCGWCGRKQPARSSKPAR